jgi:type I restriction enzyme M protein
MSAGGQDGKIRENIVRNDLVDCMVALPTQLFYNTGIPACLWFLDKDKENGKFRNRKGEVLFIDASKLGEMEDRTHRIFKNEDIQRITNIYHSWRSENEEYEDIRGFCKSVKKEEVEKHEYILTPGRYVGIEIEEENEEVLQQRMLKLTSELKEQFKKSEDLQEKIISNLGGLGYEF